VSEGKVTAVITHPSGALGDEKYRPQFHFTPEKNWMNDPNGLIYYKGEYHLFFQHNPLENVWGNMSWGHAVSVDLFLWQELPVAIPCTDDTGIFSGSTVIDYTNSAGFGSTDNPAMIAIYTEHKNDKSKQSQCLAFSLDNGRTFTKYEGNPVLDVNSPDFRDPKVQWIDNQWLMTIARPDLHQISFFTSSNLKEWKHLSDFGPAAEIGGCWECPDLFQLGDKWVLIVSLNPGGYQVGSGTQYFLGQWNGKEFIADDLRTRWLDYGRDNYAGITFNNAPDGRRIFIGWMSNWEYAHTFPTQPWRGAMTLPRELTLDADRLIQKIVGESGIPKITFSTSEGSIRINEKEDRFIEIGLREKNIFIDCTHAWSGEAEPLPKKFLLQEIAINTGEVDFEIFLDRGSIELFVDGGKNVITNLTFIEPALTSVTSIGQVRNLLTANFRHPANS
jgi:sucrose-6-phosphate hydrolase SacC (GH32 family)